MEIVLIVAVADNGVIGAGLCGLAHAGSLV